MKNQTDFHSLFADVKGVSRRSFARGECLFRQSDPAAFVYSVIAGELQLIRYTADGHSVCLHTARAGASFAEAALFTEEYHCNGEATKQTEAWCYPRLAVLKKIHEDPVCMEQFYALLVAQVRHLRLAVELRSIRSASDRVLQLFRLRADHNRRVSLSGSLVDLAGELGLAHETLYRTLSSLEEEGSIRRLDKTTFLLSLSSSD